MAKAATIHEMPPAIRDRVKEFRRVPSEELQDNERNWRVHPFAQQAALTEVLDRIGIAGALTAYYSERAGGKLTLIDGHERRGHQADWPTLILDVSDEEADLLLATFDPIGELAQMNPEAISALLQEVDAGTPALMDLLQSLEEEADGSALAALEEQSELEEDERVLPEMELQPYEHYDYVVLICRNTYDWMSLQDLLGIEQVQFTLADGTHKKVGKGRVIDAKRVIELLRPSNEPDLPDAA